MCYDCVGKYLRISFQTFLCQVFTFSLEGTYSFLRLRMILLIIGSTIINKI